VKREVIAGQFYVPSHPGVLKNVNINGNVLQRYFSHGRQFGLKCAGDRDVFGMPFSKVLGTMMHSFFFLFRVGHVLKDKIDPGNFVPAKFLMEDQKDKQFRFIFYCQF